MTILNNPHILVSMNWVHYHPVCKIYILFFKIFTHFEFVGSFPLYSQSLFILVTRSKFWFTLRFENQASHERLQKPDGSDGRGLYSRKGMQDKDPNKKNFIFV